MYSLHDPLTTAEGDDGFPDETWNQIMAECGDADPDDFVDFIWMLDDMD